VLLVPAVALCADDRPATLAAAGGNPLALNAWAFLGWYWKMLLLLAAIALVLRLFGGRQGMPGRRPAGKLTEDPYSMAYLAGGPQRVLEAVMASLVEQGALRVNAVTRELITEQELPKDRPKIERQTRSMLRGPDQAEDAAGFRRRWKRQLHVSLDLLRQGLLRAGLIARPTLQVWAAKPLALGFVALLGVGVIRLVKGVAAGRPVGFLIASMLVTGVAGWWLLRGMGREGPTAQGKRLLDESKSRLGRPADNRLWMVALLGLGGYGLGPMADLSYLIGMPEKGSPLQWLGRSRGDSSGGGSCAGGGCGGGGCGGCGGCGG